jgi:GntR family carbon starvation induced transcriptional regulator
MSRTRQQSDSSSLVDRVYTNTRRAILRGEYPPSSPLRLQELAYDNDVSLIPVREALRMLQAERLVETQPNKGARVAPISIPDLLDTYELRVVLEKEAIRRAFPNYTTEIVKQARVLGTKMTRFFKKGDDDSAFEAHRQLHYSLYVPANSPWLLHFIDVLWNTTERYRIIATPLHATPEEVKAEHAAIVEAIAENNLQAATDLLEKHLRHTAALILKAYSKDAP